jgi:hypothetical protein
VDGSGCFIDVPYELVSMLAGRIEVLLTRVDNQ